MAITAEQTTAYLALINGEDFWTPEATEGDILWWPQPDITADLQSGNHLRCLHKDNVWIEHNDQTPPA